MVSGALLQGVFPGRGPRVMGGEGQACAAAAPARRQLPEAGLLPMVSYLATMLHHAAAAEDDEAADPTDAREGSDASIPQGWQAAGGHGGGLRLLRASLMGSVALRGAVRALLWTDAAEDAAASRGGRPPNAEESPAAPGSMPPPPPRSPPDSLLAAHAPSRGCAAACAAAGLCLLSRLLLLQRRSPPRESAPLVALQLPDDPGSSAGSALAAGAACAPLCSVQLLLALACDLSLSPDVRALALDCMASAAAHTTRDDVGGLSAAAQSDALLAQRLGLAIQNSAVSHQPPVLRKAAGRLSELLLRCSEEVEQSQASSSSGGCDGWPAAAGAWLRASPLFDLMLQEIAQPLPPDDAVNIKREILGDDFLAPLRMRCQ